MSIGRQLFHETGLVLQQQKNYMLHKRYNYRRPLLLVVIFLAIFLKTNTMPQNNRGNEYNQSDANIALISKASYTEGYENNLKKKSILLSIYNRFISQFL